ncbi:MAG: hypothetical protein ACC663_10400, partial [Gammaproteobacteria bacterium]
MGLQHIFGLFVDPRSQWGKIRDANSGVGSFRSIHLYLLAAIPAIGAPNLTDRTWLYGGSRLRISESISKGRQGQMPAQREFLGEAR